MAKEIEENSQGPQKPMQKAQGNIGKNCQGSESLNTLDQTNLLNISIGSISDPEINTHNK